MTLNDPTAVIMGGEPILDGDMVLGYVTSANYGYTIKRTIAYGYLPNDHASEGTVVDIEYFGERFKASVEREPLYDPAGGKLKN